MGDRERSVVQRLRAGQPLDGLGLEKVAGRWDLRGMRLSPPITRAPGPRDAGVATVSLSGMDELRGVTLSGLGRVS